MIIPQRPYMPIGSLRQCLVYPLETVTDEVLIPILKHCHLDHLTDKLDIRDDWQNRLSLGEQQRVNFVRVLLHQPTWLVMDEPTSHLQHELAFELMAMLVKALPKSAMLIISHHKDQLPTFDHVIS